MSKQLAGGVWILYKRTSEDCWYMAYDNVPQPPCDEQFDAKHTSHAVLAQDSFPWASADEDTGLYNYHGQDEAPAYGDIMVGGTVKGNRVAASSGTINAGQYSRYLRDKKDFKKLEENEMFPPALTSTGLGVTEFVKVVDRILRTIGGYCRRQQLSPSQARELEKFHFNRGVVYAQGPCAEASAGPGGFSVGAHAGEVGAGPFAARAGAKFGAGIEDGIPTLHAGPVSCSVM